MLVALIIVSGYTSINAIVKAELFPTYIRALGVGFPYAIAVAIFGGTAEYFALYFKSIENEWGYYWYVSGLIFLSTIVYVLLPNNLKTTKLK
jgi:MHS family alpha-ketoglutarate permease-like MFS transporter